MMTKDDGHVTLSICEDVLQVSISSRRLSKNVKLHVSVSLKLFDTAISQTIQGARRMSNTSDSGFEDMSEVGGATAQAHSLGALTYLSLN
jgi:hypothetical protein